VEIKRHLFECLLNQGHFTSNGSRKKELPGAHKSKKKKCKRPSSKNYMLWPFSSASMVASILMSMIAQLARHTVVRIMSINEHLCERSVKVVHPEVIVLTVLGNLVESQSLVA